MTKLAFVSGGSKGIGLGCVLRLVEAGYQVITCSRNVDVWQAVVTEYPALKTVDYQQANLADQASLEQLFRYIREQYGQLDIAINNASPALGSGGLYHQVDMFALKETLNNDFWGHAQCLQYQIKLMETGGAIVNVSSINGLRPTPNAAMYSAAKHALEGLTQSVALEAIRNNIRINAVAPGVTWTPRWDERQTRQPTIKLDVEEQVPAKRFARVEEVVDAIEFLLSDKASYIVGHTLVVDGGLSLV
ncbi:dehydrogenase [Salinivibrio sp. PR5]|uniref:SDR family NAD(P)-dependent oxidoreductase n=1 Tax=Salinivibrio sp. PR5 TaxID=1909484 RepID=UPI000989D245|nr:SDR family oxidoreductase [Salinivibrio sp. PR5]OOF09739.1 dehydrogenase [Salinivibrio sp. PR5]